jgi:glutamate racemase
LNEVFGVSDSAAIGVFDSGVGGLSILKEIRRILPGEDLLYLADSAHCPYGTKPVPEIRARSLAVTAFLVELGVKTVVVACNTASVAGLDQVRQAYPLIPIVGVEPALKPAHNLTRNGKIGVLATNLTLKGDRFTVLVERFGADVKVYTQPAPGLVELVENGELDTPIAEELLHQYLEPLLKERVDTLVLGCTHYPFLIGTIRKICGPDVTVIDTGLAVAKQTLRILEQNRILNPKTNGGKEVFHTSGDPAAVEKVIKKLWTNTAVEVFKASI